MKINGGGSGLLWVEKESYYFLNWIANTFSGRKKYNTEGNCTGLGYVPKTVWRLCLVVFLEHRKIFWYRLQHLVATGNFEILILCVLEIRDSNIKYRKPLCRLFYFCVYIFPYRFRYRLYLLPYFKLFHHSNVN